MIATGSNVRIIVIFWLFYNSETNYCDDMSKYTELLEKDRGMIDENILLKNKIIELKEQIKNIKVENKEMLKNVKNNKCTK